MLRAERTKKTVITISFVVIAASLGVVGLLVSIAFVGQGLTLSNEQKKTDELVAKIESQEDLDKVLTVQSQLIELTPLHESKPVVTRLFDYIQQTTPADVSLDTYDLSLIDNRISMEGGSTSLELVNKYVDTLKFTEISFGTEDASEEKAFSEVVLTDFSKTKDGATFTISLAFKPELFSFKSKDISLVVPNIVTTRSQTQSPGALFVPNEEEN
jgi:hypothetical protein